MPCRDQSGGRDRLGHLTREGAPVVRQLLAEAAWQAQRRSPTVRASFEWARHGDPQRKKIALVATADYLVRVMWAVLRRGTAWQEGAAQAAWAGRSSPGPRTRRFDRPHIETESGTRVAPRGPTWRTATPLA